ncbi:MAG: DNA-3-methyladenine glycosylase [Myxococcales bacterium]|nr:DNA-3-methyladenine glycosylase [Myxococcales bacterium]
MASPKAELFLIPGTPVAAARWLLGSTLSVGPVRVRIVEVEAYGGLEDSASHARFGITARNAPMWDGPGRLYVYLCYGIHWMVNITYAPMGTGGAVLLRGGIVEKGHDWVERRRGSLDLLGPGKLGQALGLTKEDSGRRLNVEDWLRVQAGAPVRATEAGPRVGIGYATPRDQRLPWRFRER